eukprot:2038887-Pleurochrysis_carterae.AAC.1
MRVALQSPTASLESMDLPDLVKATSLLKATYEYSGLHNFARHTPAPREQQRHLPAGVAPPSDSQDVAATDAI